MNDREAINRIMDAARLTGLAAFIGETQLAGWGESHDSGAKVAMWLPDSDDLAPFRGMTTKKGKKSGQRLAVIAFEIGEDEQPVTPSEGKLLEVALDHVAHGVPEKPYGKYAAELHRLGWWYNPKVLAAIGTDGEYRAWIQKQKCICCGGQDWVQEIGEGRCEAAHVKGPGNSGMAHKPDYSCVPLCNKHHVPTQHQHGLTTLYMEHHKVDLAKTRLDGALSDYRLAARQWFEKCRDHYLKRWASASLASQLGYASMGMVPPGEIFDWAKQHLVNVRESHTVWINIYPVTPMTVLRAYAHFSRASADEFAASRIACIGPITFKEGDGL